MVLVRAAVMMQVMEGGGDDRSEGEDEGETVRVGCEGGAGVAEGEVPFRRGGSVRSHRK